ncbi:hypothetical protein BaRGS_00016967 [Batillaria attramentaria]|uniref:Uncharacterized protein n=1 Tax=Batillaria attramentaria TaxID=370345 RepID=A0ABD0KWN2_9CAEN
MQTNSQSADPQPGTHYPTPKLSCAAQPSQKTFSQFPPSSVALTKFCVLPSPHTNTSALANVKFKPPFPYSPPKQTVLNTQGKNSPFLPNLFEQSKCNI